ncbi:MAG TPA: tRNA (adenosine(37)-N6)-threonylcarbamoyltransferase complex ATPase subunit type 1 TsaE [Candidatus Methylomirabilis sp.]|nr:tRNA (adenosine(37)-N6)-threonylcarbamoyltransferase complex ATPase subunit type 1 TsaE [Candidatus Methylomirabilis sp.]
MSVRNLHEYSLVWDSTSAEETERMGESLGLLLQPGDVIALFGELGSGKTVLVRGMAGGYGCAKGDVHSPSFTLVNEYVGPPVGAVNGGERRLAHVDLYRIRSEDELPGIGWDEVLHSRHVVAVEWAERALRWMPGDHLRVTLETLGQERRRLHVQGMGPRSVELTMRWAETGGFPAERT